MPRRGVATVLVLVALLVGLGAEDALAHSGLVGSDPAAGVTLGDTPAAVQLSFSEEPRSAFSGPQLAAGLAAPNATQRYIVARGYERRVRCTDA